MIRIAALVLAICGMVSMPVAAQNFPTKQIRTFVGYAAGGSSDLLARIAADAMGRQLGQPVVVENRTGANGALAAAAVKNAEPDGYTLYSGSVSTFSPVFMKASILAIKELAPVSTTGTMDFFAYARAGIGIDSLRDIATYARAHRGQSGGKLRLGISASSNTMQMAAIAKELGISFADNFEVIPYKTSDQIIQGLLSGDVHLAVNVYAGGWEPHVAAGRLRGLAVLTDQRSSLSPNVPTAAEQGVPLQLRSIHGVWAPLTTPRDVISKLSRAVVDGMRQPGVPEKVAALAMTSGGSSPEELLKRTSDEFRFQSEFAKELGVEPQ